MMDALLAVVLALPATVAAGELRGLWVVRTALVSPQAVDAVVDQAQAAGFNALFVQVRGRGDAFYASRVVPRSVLLERQPLEFDPLSRLLSRARSRGVEVHAWVNVLLSAHFGQPVPPEHVMLRHPEWLMVPKSAARAALVASPRSLPGIIQQARDSDVEGYYLSPLAPGVAESLEEVVRELVRSYRVDGLHLDFIRYPGPDYDYSRAALDGFRQRNGGADPLSLPSSLLTAWSDYRREALTSLAERLSRAARKERGGLVISAAVVPDEASATTQKFQDWPSWLSRGILDAVCPMTYTVETPLFRRQVEQAKARATASQPVWAGVGAYRLTLDGIIEKIRAARVSGASGTVVFSHESLTGVDLRRLRLQAFPDLGAAGSAGDEGRLQR